MSFSRRKFTGLIVILSVILLVACNSNDTNVSETGNATDETISVVTTIAQIGEPLSVIGGDRLNVESLMGPSVDPHVYNATQSDIEKIENADLIFYNGLDLEANMVEIFEQIGKSRPVLAIGEEISEDLLLTDEDGAL